MATAIFERSEKPLFRVYDGDVLTIKRCGRCGAHKAVRRFQKDASRKDGYMTRCKACCGVADEDRQPAEHGSESRYKKGCRCSTCFSAHSDRCKAYRQRHAKPDAYCECGALLGRRNRTGVCRACQNAARVKRRAKLARRETLKRQHEKHAEGTVGHLVWRAGTCVQCGNAFVKKRGGAYCTRKCRLLAKGHIRRVVERGPDSIKGSWQVFNRDNFICWLCNEKCDPTAHYLDANYPTLDHVIPVSLGGAHTMDNLRTAHRHCNSTRTGPGQGR